MADRSRRSFLLGRFAQNGAKKSSPVRPPWAIDEKTFLDKCTRCNACIQSCPENIIIKGDGGFPEVNFQLGECTFCQACEERCSDNILNNNALDKNHARQPWQHSPHINDSCLSLKDVTCSRCADECESRSIKLNYSAEGICKPEVDHCTCSGCGACIPVCPVSAINIQPHSHEP